MPHILHELRVGNRPRRETGPRAPSLRFVAVALITAEAHEQLASIRGISLRNILLLLRRRLLCGKSDGNSPGDDDCRSPGERKRQKELFLHNRPTVAA